MVILSFVTNFRPVQAAGYVRPITENKRRNTGRRGGREGDGKEGGVRLS